jgi:hypothetical protein
MDEYLSGLACAWVRLPLLSWDLMCRSEDGRQPSLLPLVRTDSVGKVTSDRVFHFEAVPDGCGLTLAVTIP